MELIISVIFNLISIPAAIYFGVQNLRIQKQSDHANKTEELGVVETQLNRLGAIEHAAKAGSYQYGTLIHDGVLSTEIVNNIFSKCKKYGIQGKELDQFISQANSSLANKTWDKTSSYGLVKAAKALEGTIKNA
ncbi:MAG: hypothetical protein ACQESI_02465 [Pseudomonadota bacterium]